MQMFYWQVSGSILFHWLRNITKYNKSVDCARTVFVHIESESLTLCSVGSDNAHGADPVGRDLGYQRVQHLQAGGVHHKDLWVMAVTEQTSLPLSAYGELIELKNQRGSICLSSSAINTNLYWRMKWECVSPVCQCEHRPAWWTQYSVHHLHPINTSPWKHVQSQVKRHVYVGHCLKLGLQLVDYI